MLGDSGEHGTPSPALSDSLGLPVTGDQAVLPWRDQCCQGNMGTLGYQEVKEGFLEEVTAKPRPAEQGGVSQTRAQLVLVPGVRAS